MSEKRGKDYEQDQIEPGGVPLERIVFVEDEAGALFSGEHHLGKTNALDKIFREWLEMGRKVAADDVKADPELGARLNAKREEIERDLPGWMASMRPQYSDPQWAYRDQVHDGSRYAPGDWGISIMDLKVRDDLRLETPDWFPVRVGDVARVIDTQRGERPVPGHVVDIDGWWVFVSGPLGRKQLFYGQTGYRAGEYRWRLEPYITEEGA